MTVSVLTVSYNALSTGQLRGELLEAIAAARAEIDCELVVIDNGSDDDTPVALARWAERFPFLRYAALPERIPYVDALASAVELARCDTCLVVDVDEANQALLLPALLPQLAGHACLHGLRASRPFSSRRFSSLLFNGVYRHLLRHRLRDIGHNHYLLSRPLLLELLECVRAEHWSAMPLAIERVGLDIVQVRVPSTPAGRSSYRWLRRSCYVGRFFWDALRVRLTRHQRVVTCPSR